MMEAYDKDFSEDELELLLAIQKKKKIKKIAIITSIVLVVALFVAFTIGALLYNPMDLADDIVERYPF